MIVAWSAPACDKDNGGLTLPAGLCALVVAGQLGSVRHLVVRDHGDIYLMLLQGRHGVMGLRDENGDGRMGRRVSFGSPGTGEEQLPFPGMSGCVVIANPLWMRLRSCQGCRT